MYKLLRQNEKKIKFFCENSIDKYIKNFDSWYNIAIYVNAIRKDKKKGIQTL